MKRYFFFTILFYLVFLTFVSYKVSKAYFTDMAVASANTFTAAAEFPTTTITPTPDLTGTPTPTPTGEPTISAGDVVINEIMWMGSELSTADEWIELRNMTGSPIIMTNWIVERLGDGSPSEHLTFSGTISANGFFLIANTSNTSVSSILNTAPDVTTTDIELLDSGEQLILKSDTGSIIDTANTTPSWLSGINGSASVPNASMERASIPGDGTSAGTWSSSSTQVNLDTTIDFATPKASND